MNVFDRKYCIMDSSGNYYSINEYDALVVTKGEETARWFDILEANKRISESGLSKTLRTIAVNKQTTKKKENTDLYEQGELGGDEFCMKKIDFNRLTKELSFIQANYQKYLANVKEQQTVVDAEICDILHFIELYQHDNEQDLELVEQIQKCRERRRRIKDIYYQVETFGKIFTVGGMSNVLKEITKKLNSMETREYMPRRLPQLFVQGVKRIDQQDDYLQGEMIQNSDCADTLVPPAIMDNAETDIDQNEKPVLTSVQESNQLESDEIKQIVIEEAV